MENSRDALFRHDFKTGTAEYLSDSIEALSGYTTQEYDDQGLDLWINNIHPDDQHHLLQFISECRKGTFSGSSSQMEYRFRHKNGHWVWVSDTVSIVRNNEGEIEAAIGVMRDITDLKKHQQMLQTSEQRFKRLAEASFEAILIHEKGKVIDVNQRFIEMHGFSFEELQTLDLLELIAPECHEMMLEKHNSNFQAPYEVTGLRKDGSRFPLEIRAKFTTINGRSVRIAISRDLTDQKMLQQQLEESEALYRTVVENTDEAIMIVDHDGIFRFCNTQTLQGLDLTREQFVGKTISDLFPKEFADSKKQYIKQILQDGKSLKIVEQTPLKGQWRWHEITMVPLQNTEGQFDRILKISKDIHEEKLLQERLEKSEQDYRQLYDNAHVALFRSSLDGTLLHCNKACLSFFGYSRDTDEQEYLNKVRVTDYYVDQKRRQQFIEALKNNQSVQHFEVELKRSCGTTFWASISAKIFPEERFIEGAIYDITAKKLLTKTERKVLQILLQGKSNKEIAKVLGRSVRTIEDHRAHIMQKLDVDNVFDLAKITLEFNNNQYAE